VHLVDSNLQRAAPPAGADTGAAVQGLRQFGFSLINAERGSAENGNRVVSPASVGAAFAMGRSGARGTTADQIDDVLGFPPDTGPVYNTLTAQWSSQCGRDAPQTRIAHAVFAQEGLPLKQNYLDAMATDFGAGVRAVDFAEPAAADLINDWVRQETRDHIDKLFDILDPETRLVLANAIYLEAQWVTPFPAASTSAAPFDRAEGGTVQVDTMLNTAPFDYADGDGWSAVRLPYKGRDLAMWVLLPDTSSDPIALLEPAVLSQAARRASTQMVQLSLPKWDFQSNLPLIEALKNLGMTAPFTDAADFSGITDVELLIDQVQHRADITVDEKGTEAAAVTGIALRELSGPPVSDVRMGVDHPFAFVVLHELSGAPLFEGVVGDPSATQ
jgi:serpin B